MKRYKNFVGNRLQLVDTGIIGLDTGLVLRDEFIGGEIDKQGH